MLSLCCSSSTCLQGVSLVRHPTWNKTFYQSDAVMLVVVGGADVHRPAALVWNMTQSLIFIPSCPCSHVLKAAQFPDRPQGGALEPLERPENAAFSKSNLVPESSHVRFKQTCTYFCNCCFLFNIVELLINSTRLWNDSHHFSSSLVQPATAPPAGRRN